MEVVQCAVRRVEVMLRAEYSSLCILAWKILNAKACFCLVPEKILNEKCPGESQSNYVKKKSR
jgi:hypothetical protein